MQNLLENFLEKERLGKLKRQWGEAQEFCFLYKYRRVLDRKDPFSRISWENILRRTISFYNKELHVFSWRNFCGVSNVCHGLVGCELFLFQLVSMNCEIILTYWILSCYECAPVYFVKFPHWVMNVLINNKLSCCLSFYWYSCVQKR